MTDLRKAAEQAAIDLEELIHWHGVRDSNDKLMPAHNQTPEIKSAMESLDALRQALEQPEQYDQTALELCDVCGWKAIIPDKGCLVCARKKQEPVAWIHTRCGHPLYLSFQYHAEDIPLYTAPSKREWKNLTPDDKHFLLANAWNKEQAFDGFMDAIDKFLEEKNT